MSEPSTPAASRREKLAAARAKAERTEKRRKVLFFTGLGLILTFIVGVIIAAIVSRPPAFVPTGDQLVPKNITTDGSFHLLQNGSVNQDWKAEDKSKQRLQIFMDPQCPACGMVDRATNESVKRYLSEGKVDLYINLVSFLDGASTDRYSSRAVNALVTVAEEDPENFYNFMTEVYKLENQPKEGSLYRPTSNETLARWAKKAGVKPEAADKILLGSYMDWVVAHSTKQVERTDLFASGFSTPAFFVGGSMDASGVVKGAERLVFTSNEDLNVTLAQGLGVR